MVECNNFEGKLPFQDHIKQENILFHDLHLVIFYNRYDIFSARQGIQKVIYASRLCCARAKFHHMIPLQKKVSVFEVDDVHVRLSTHMGPLLIICSRRSNYFVPHQVRTVIGRMLG